MTEGPVVQFQPERVIRFRLRTVFSLLAIVLSVLVLIRVLSITRGVLTWILIALFLSLALNPLVEWIQRHGVRRRGLAIGILYVGVLLVAALVGALLLPNLIDEVNAFVTAVPDYVQDLTRGRGPFGFLEREYNITERVRRAIEERGPQGVLGISGTAFSIAKGVINIVIATITIAVLTFFMLLEGPGWIERLSGLLPDESRGRYLELGRAIYRTIGGYVAGALVVAIIAGVTASIFLSIVGVPFALALGLLVAILDLIPLVGATLAAVVACTVAFIHSWPVGVACVIFFLVYQQIENHAIYPAVYSRTVQLSPLLILMAVLVGASLAGILGALAAIPVAGSLQVIVQDVLEHRKKAAVEKPPEAPPETI